MEHLITTENIFLFKCPWNIPSSKCSIARGKKQVSTEMKPEYSVFSDHTLVKWKPIISWHIQKWNNQHLNNPCVLSLLLSGWQVYFGSPFLDQSKNRMAEGCGGEKYDQPTAARKEKEGKKARNKNAPFQALPHKSVPSHHPSPPNMSFRVHFRSKP